MGMKVNVHQQILVLVGILLNGSFESPNCRLYQTIWVIIKPVKVLISCVKPVIAPGYPIRIKCWYNLEDEVLPKKSSLVTSKVSDKVDHTVQHVGARYLAWMDS